jgi:hypothetical protein
VHDGPDLGVHGHVLPHAHAVLGVDLEGVLLDADVVLERGLGLEQADQRVLSLPQLVLQQPHGLADLGDLTLQPAWERGGSG